MKKITRTSAGEKESEEQARGLIENEIERMKMVQSLFEGYSDREFSESRETVIRQYKQATEMVSTLYAMYKREYELVDRLQNERKQLDDFLMEQGIKMPFALIKNESEN